MPYVALGFCIAFVSILTLAMPSLAQTPEPGSQAGEIAALKKQAEEQKRIIEQLLDANRALAERIRKLEEAKAPEYPAPLPVPRGRAAALPDISVIGNHLGRFLSVKGDPNRNRFQLGEFEVGIQQRIYPGVRFDSFLAAGAEGDFRLNVEEAYATVSNVAGTKLGAVLGQKRLNIGKINPVHQHARNYADQPAALGAFLGEEALSGNGAALNYTIPAGNLFANLEVGFARVTGHAHGAEEEHDEKGNGEETLAGRFSRRSRGRAAEVAHPEPGLGIPGDFPYARLWLSKDLGSFGELELGGSYGFGKGENGDNIRLASADFTLRQAPAAFKRLLLQGEWFQHRRSDTAGGSGVHRRTGYYLYAGYRPDQYSDFGVRYDRTSFPWPVDGKEETWSLIYTNRLTEQTLVRLQWKLGNRLNDVYLPYRRGLSDLLLQFLWGGGAHTHSIQ